MVGRIDFEAVKKYLLGRLQRGLSPHLYYHGVHHTRDYVLPAFERLASLEGVNGQDLLIGKTAALYHDAGYLEQYSNNEPYGVSIATKFLPIFGYNEEQIHKIGKIIMATQMVEDNGIFRQNPDKNDVLQMIMCDADLYHLGMSEFFRLGESLRLELMAHTGKPISESEWNEKQLEFLESHSYFTNAARVTRNQGKENNIRLLKIHKA